MAIKITGTLTPKNISLDTYAITESKYNKGGHHEVLTIIERDSIFDERRSEGMTCYVAESGLTYQLQSGITNLDWVEFGVNSDTGVTNDVMKYLLHQTDTEVMWGGEIQYWTDGDENPIAFEVKSDKEHIVDLYNRDIDIERQVIDIGRYVELLYVELVILKDNSELVPGKRYKIMDFQTIHDIPNTSPWEQHIGAIEQIVVVANTENTLSPTAYSEVFPDDEIIYDLEKNTTDKTNTPRPGWIEYRKERIKQVETSFDFREVTLRRWRITSNATYNVGATYNSTAWVKDAAGTRLYRSLIDGNLGQDLLDIDYWLEMENNFLYYSGVAWSGVDRFANLYETYFLVSGTVLALSLNIAECSNIKMTNTTLEIPNNYITNLSNNADLIECKDNTFYNGIKHCGALYDVYGNYFTSLTNTKIGTNVKYNFLASMTNSELGSDAIGNHVNYFRNSRVGKQSYQNVIDNMTNVTLGELAQHNVITGQFDKNVIGGTFKYNKCNFFSTNVIGEGWQHNETKTMTNNSFGNFCSNNKIYRMSNNIVGSSFSDNTFDDNGNSRDNNRIGDNFSNNNVNGYFNYNIIGNGCDANIFNSWFEYNNIIGKFVDNVNASTFRHNKISTFFQHNNLSGSTVSNSFGTFQGNTALGNLSYNSMGNANVAGNIFGENFEKNTISLSLANSTFGANAQSNFLNGETNQNITCGTYFQKNIFDDRLINTTTLDNFRYNHVKCEVNGADYTSATHVYTALGSFLTKEIIRNADTTNNIRLLYYDSGNVLQNVLHTS